MREEEKKRTSQDSSFKRFFQKRWVFPAIYIASAAIILTAVLWYQTSGNNAADKKDNYDYNASDIAGKNNNPPAMEVNSALENVAWPVKDYESYTIQKGFYDVNGTDEEQQAALVSYNNSFSPNTGIDLTAKNGETFDVVAALTGTVTDVREDSILGNVIEITHDNNVVTEYQSVKDFTVKAGDQVNKGQVIAKAGQSLLNQEAGVHVHFEIRKDSYPVNPTSFFDKPVSSIVVDKPADDNSAVEEQKADPGTHSNPTGAGTEKSEPGTSDNPTGAEKETPGTDKSQDSNDSKQPADQNDSSDSKTNS